MKWCKSLFFFMILIGCPLLMGYAELLSWMCGPYALCQVAERYGKVVDPEVVAELSRTTEAGTTMKGLADAAYQLGMKTVGQKTNYQNLLQLTPPLIALVRTQDSATGNHFIVIDKIAQDQIEIWDVNRGYAIYPKEVFESMWDGYVLVISPPIQQQISVDAPDIEIAAPIHDFGAIPQLEAVEHTFTIKNVGQQPLDILEVNPSCTCEKVDLKEKMIPPGGQTSLDVRYRGSTNGGKTRVAVYLKTNDPDEPEVVVSLVGVINGIAGVYPGHFNLGNIGQEESIRKSFVIYPRTYGHKLTVKSVTASSPLIKTKLQKVKDTEILARVNFEIQELPLGPIHETITVTTNAEKYPEIHVGIEGVVVGELLLEPNQFFMGFLKIDKPVHRTVTIEKRGKANLKILKVENRLPFIEVKTIAVEPGKKFQIEATCTPTAFSPKSIRDVVQIHTNSKKQPLLEVSVYGVLQKPSSDTNQDE
ncbi:hypothetical protein C6499_01825 [Candidatus Poribacteria bacterium]|nr:MAG: hypothetical protein C6499_01825 [Candidatus Poribacteria bacterium]